MDRLLKTGALALALLCSSGQLLADSIASYPENWRDWPVVSESMVPGRDVVLPEDTPLFIQEAVSAYNWINDGQGTKLTVHVHPDKIEQYKTHGPYDDGITVIGVYETPGVIFVTEHLAGQPLYGTYDYHGVDISEQHATFAPEFCERCHTAYQDICINGTCSTSVIELFD
ncbi:hypothetical protein [Aliagarivorans marinus]|uniref:hypothetical protein n=1 Tax=Aliagarivorans marinus TaxID=561965 RepID=UPI000478F94E|nr:hypothetical protein [Aliagarivorans marinus]